MDDQTRLLELAARKPGERVLEVACGTGLVSFPAALAVGAGGEAVATDISEVMVTHLQTDAIARGIDNVVTTRADAEKLDMPDAPFDLPRATPRTRNTSIRSRSGRWATATACRGSSWSPPGRSSATR